MRSTFRASTAIRRRAVISGLLIAGSALIVAGTVYLPALVHAAGVGPGFKPVPFPDPKIPGFVFPEKEAIILGWTQKNNMAAISRHGWGIWTGLTMPSGETFEGQSLRVFETWFTPGDLTSAQARGLTQLQTLVRDPRPLGPLPQFKDPKRPGRLRAAHGDSTVTGFVKYDPSAAQFILKKQLFSKKALDAMLTAGKTDIPDFPTTSISLKPVFTTIEQGNLVGGRYYMLAAWPGPPTPATSFPSSAWKQCVWVDVKDLGNGPGTGKVDTVCNPNGSSRTAATTYGLGRFIHFQVSSSQAQAVNTSRIAMHITKRTVATGDYAILNAMHVTSREITRWTWQSYWWSPNPDAPPLPSSSAIAALRPAQLKGAPRNYSMTIAYSMEVPPQPNTGGKNVGNSIYAFNPWLEAAFAPSDLPASQPGMYHGMSVPNNVGVQTNCMSCHAQAAYASNGTDLTATLYTGDQYIDMKGPQFKGYLRTDFLWSIPFSAQ